MAEVAREGAYSGLGAREGSARGDANIAGRIEALESLAPVRGNRLLDIGCGNGAYTLKLLEGFNEVVGVDIEPDRISDFRRAAMGLPVAIHQCSATAVPYGDGYFDAVTAIETMEHLGVHLEPTLSEMARVLRSRGRLYLTTPNRLWPFEQHGFTFRGRRYPGLALPFLTWFPPLHRRLSPDDAFLPTQLDRLVEPHGFRRIGVTYMWPPLDGHQSARKAVRPIFSTISRTPLRRFAQTLVMAYERI